MNANITKPFKTATPDNAINPTPAEIESGMSRSHNANIPPVNAQQSLFRDAYQNMVNMIGVLHRSGVTIVAGTDDVAGISLPRELELYVEAGIPPRDVLRIATSAAAPK